MLFTGLALLWLGLSVLPGRRAVSRIVRHAVERPPAWNAERELPALRFQWERESRTDEERTSRRWQIVDDCGSRH